MEDGGADIARCPRQLLIALQRGAGQIFLRPVAGHGRGFHDPPGQADAVRRHLPVSRSGEIIRADLRLVLGMARQRMHMAPALGPQIADTGGDRREGMQRLAELVERQRLHVIFDVGRLEGGIRLGKDAQLARRHGHGAGAVQRIFQRDARLAEEVARHLVQRLCPMHLEDGAQLQMILKVLAHLRQTMTDRDADAVQHIRIADA